MDNVQPIAPQNLTVEAPAELRELQGWLIWRFEPDPSNPKGKPLKVPYYADGGKRYGKQGGIDDRGRMTTFAAARDAAARRGFTGVGLALMPEFGITALDFDNCVDAGGHLPPVVRDIASQTYAEYSPSGKGVRAFVRGSYGNHKSPTEGNDFGFEVFTSNGFVTFTGNAMPYTDLLGLEDTIADLDALVAPLCAARFRPTAPHVPDPDDFMVGREPFGFLRLLRIEGLVVNYAAYSAIMGGVLAFILFTVSAFSIPLIYDGRAQLVSGVVASVRAVFGRFGVMMCWALLLAAVIIVSTLLLPLLLLTLPVMAYASREFYFRTFPPEAGAPTA